jgi:cell fate regulator YaaT (PSP1 superfamily)
MNGQPPPENPRTTGLPPREREQGVASVPQINIAGVRLRPGGRSYTCDAGNLAPKVGTRVVIQADRGPEIGIVMVAASLRPSRSRIPRILRIADQRDLDRADGEDRRVAEALSFARTLVKDRKLPIKIFHAELSSQSRAMFYFASEARIDFRDLVRDLSGHLHLRVEMRQVGVRDEAKMVGGLGSCGRELCCSTFLPRFAPISIKAAKNQNIALTPSKVTGQCGRLKCCLVYEEANYIEAAKSLPRMGKRVETPDGIGRVGDLDVLRGRVRVLFPDGPPKVYQGNEVKTLAMPGGPTGGAPGGGAPPDPDEEPNTGGDEEDGGAGGGGGGGANTGGR